MILSILNVRSQIARATVCDRLLLINYPTILENVLWAEVVGWLIATSRMSRIGMSLLSQEVHGLVLHDLRPNCLWSGVGATSGQTLPNSTVHQYSRGGRTPFNQTAAGAAKIIPVPLINARNINKTERASTVSSE